MAIGWYTDFKTVTIDHSDTPPSYEIYDLLDIILDICVKSALFLDLTPFTPAGSILSSNVIALACIPSIICE